MKNFFINSAISVTSVCLFLALVEVAFQQNAAYKWVAFERYQPHLSEVFPEEPIPPEITLAARKKIPSPEYDQASWNKVDARINEKNWHAVPISANHLITQRRGHRQAVTVFEETRLGKDEYYKTVYTMDENHIRKSTDRPYDTQKKNLLVMGCSIAFGKSLPDDETIGAHLARAFPQMNVYNLGVQGGGMTNILNDIHYGDRISAINKNGGAAIYVYFRDHFRRHFSGLEFFRRDSQEGFLNFSVSNGLLLATEPDSLQVFERSLLKWLSRSEFLYSTGWGYHTFSRANQQMFVDYMVFVRDFYKVKYNMDFYLYVREPHDLPSRWLYDELNGKGIKIVLHESIYNHFGRHDLLIPADHHPNARGAYLYSRLIEARLRRDGI